MPRENVCYEKSYRQRKKIQRIQSKKFDKECKKKKAQSQAKWRLKKKQQQIAPLPTPVLAPLTVSRRTDLRKVEGLKRRRQHLSQLNAQLEDLRQTVRQLSNENKKLKRSRSMSPPRPSPTTLLLSNVSPLAKRRATDRAKEKKDLLSRGSQRDFRTTFGINLSEHSQPKHTSSSRLRIAIEKFLCQDHISKLCPDKNKTIDRQQIRYRLNHLSTLHQIFEYETQIDIDYVTFTRCVPSYIKKPSVESWGTCLCVYCLNPQMKYEKLRQAKNPPVKTVMQGAPVNLSELVKDEDSLQKFKLELLPLENEKLNLTFSEWQKQKKPNCSAAISTKMTLTLSIQDFLRAPSRVKKVFFLQSTQPY